MALSQSTLATELESQIPEGAEAAAISNFADLYASYTEAAAALTPLLAAGVALGKAAMPAAMTGMSVSGAGAGKIVAGIQAFWVGVAGGLAASFVGATAITPPPHSGLLAALQPVFDSNTSGSRSLADSAAAVAVVMHAQAIIGGTVTTTGPTVTPIL